METGGGVVEEEGLGAEEEEEAGGGLLVPEPGQTGGPGTMYVVAVEV